MSDRTSNVPTRSIPLADVALAVGDKVRINSRHPSVHVAERARYTGVLGEVVALKHDGYTAQVRFPDGKVFEGLITCLVLDGREPLRYGRDA